MSESKWQCNYDDHINKFSDQSCEICGKHRPVIEYFTYQILEEFGTIKVSWSIENFKKGNLKYDKENIAITDTKGVIVLKKIRHKKKIVLNTENDTCEIIEEKIILLKEPEILKFNSNTLKVLENSLIDLTWETRNATNVSISSLGLVYLSGYLKSVKPKPSFKIIAENEVGKSEQEIRIEVLALSKIKEFKCKHQKIEFGKETSLVWNVENAKRVELHWLGNLEVNSNKGEKKVAPTENTTYKLVVTALDGKTIFTKETNVRVFHKIQFTSFTTNLHQIPRGVEVELSWDVEYAENLVLRSNDGLNEKVSSTEVFKLFPTKSVSYWLEGKNDLFNAKSNTLRIEVDNAPQMSKIPSFFEENQIPLIDLKMPELKSIILDETQLEFEKMIQPKRSFSISKTLNSILRK